MRQEVAEPSLGLDPVELDRSGHPIWGAGATTASVGSVNLWKVASKDHCVETTEAVKSRDIVDVRSSFRRGLT